MKNRRQEFVLMALPVVFLGITGWVLRNRKAAQILPNEPFRLRVEKVTPAPLTAHEVFDGYDTKVLLTLDHSGEAPPWWDKGFSGYSSMSSGKVVVVNSAGKRHQVGVPFVSQPYRLENGEWQAKILAGLGKISPTQGELRFVDSMAVYSNMQARLSPLLPLDFRLRQRGQTTPTPNVDRHSHIKVDKVFVSPSPSDRESARVKVWVSAPEVDSWGNLTIRDANGKKIPSYGEFSTDDFAIGGSEHERKLVFVGDVDLSTIKTPLANSEAIFYNQEEWPLRVPIPLRDATGKRFNTPTGQPNCRLNHISTRKATSQERTKYACDTVISLSVGSLRREAHLIHSWDVNLGAHIEAQDGEEWWASNLATQNTPSSYINDFPTEMTETGDGYGRTGRELNYYVNLSTIPKSAGPLWFMDSIRLNDGPVLPVKIQVRK